MRLRAAVEEVRRTLPEVSERRAGRVLGPRRAVQRYTARVRDDEAPLTGRIVELASVYGRYGSPRITGTLRNEGWNVNHKRAERIWRQAGLKVPRQLGSDDVLERLSWLMATSVSARSPMAAAHA